MPTQLIVLDTVTRKHRPATAAEIASQLTPISNATDTAAGTVALNTGTAAGDATNATDALTAAGAAELNRTAAVPNTGSPDKPTAAPTEGSPSRYLKNSNGETFWWNGASWELSGNGFSSDFTNLAGISIPSASASVSVAVLVVPRDGVINISASCIQSTSTSIPANIVDTQVRLNGVNLAPIRVVNHSVADIYVDGGSASVNNVVVSVGDVLEIHCSQVGSSNFVAYFRKLNYFYTK